LASAPSSSWGIANHQDAIFVVDWHRPNHQDAIFVVDWHRPGQLAAAINEATSEEAKKSLHLQDVRAAVNDEDKRSLESLHELQELVFFVTSPEKISEILSLLNESTLRNLKVFHIGPKTGPYPTADQLRDPLGKMESLEKLSVGFNEELKFAEYFALLPEAAQQRCGQSRG
jgi:hypothetical protein